MLNDKEDLKGSCHDLIEMLSKHVPGESKENHENIREDFFYLKAQFILQPVVILVHSAECYGERVLQCLGERPSVGPLCR
jgi:hypothetical protein